MGEHKAAVDAYIARSAPFAQPILHHLRALVHSTCPEARESIKWSMPFFTHGDTILCNMAAFRAHCSFGFWDRRMTPRLAEHGVLCNNAMGSLGRIRSVDDLPGDAVLTALLAEARRLTTEEAREWNAAGRRKRPELEPPPDLLAALARTPGAAERFAEMPPGGRRDYIEWVLEAKRSETRERRIGEAAARIAEGKSYNDEYRARTRAARDA